MFRPGEKVVCLYVPQTRVDGNYTFGTDETFPEVGKTYTIRKSEVLLADPRTGLMYEIVHLEEIRNEVREYAQGFQEFGFGANMFGRPKYQSVVESLKLSVAVD